MFKQATVDDNPDGIRWIDSDLIGLTQKNRNKKRGPIRRKKASLAFRIESLLEKSFFDWD